MHPIAMPHPALQGAFFALKTSLLPLIGLFLLIGSRATAQTPDPASKKMPYHLYSIYFGGGSAYIDEEQIQGLNDWLEGIPGVEDHTISIHGHTDNIGGLEYNQWLSQKRCHAALQLLLQRGLESRQITFQDFGELNPVYDNNTWEGQRRNRRVDIIIWPLIL